MVEHASCFDGSALIARPGRGGVLPATFRWIANAPTLGIITTTMGLIMRITVFGASGGTGRSFVHQALVAGHEVIAVVRNPGSLNDLPTHTGRVEIRIADVMNPADIAPHMQHADVVVSMLGTRGNPMRATTVCSDAMDSILETMETSAVRRLLVMSAADFGNARHDGVVMRYALRPLVRGFLHGSLRDLRLMEAKIVATNVDWTVVRAPQLLNQTRGDYRTAIGHNLAGALFARRADVADFVVRNLENSDTFRQFVTVAR